MPYFGVWCFAINTKTNWSMSIRCRETLGASAQLGTIPSTENVPPANHPDVIEPIDVAAIRSFTL